MHSPVLVYHGTKARHSVFDSKVPINGLGLGPGIYGTFDPEVAECYVGEQGGIALLEFQLSPSTSFDLDLDWREQDAMARRRVESFIVARENQSTHEALSNARIGMMQSLRRGYDECARLLHTKLADAGIQLLHGHLALNQDGGRRDRGRQLLWIGEPLEPLRFYSRQEVAELRCLPDPFETEHHAPVL